ncbi:MAG: hypothetical protein CO041_04350 [Candidatus Pacebacteria bacterium CG_4_9_14_0_2_um_filter_40_15]|nr:MAG: hypothetical protein COY01_02970 [Candidatus Pacebacteria bacterium CG_4_10_14_0_2_um_filter_40_20]PJC41506.1 MAG: hypothetical protein CO041_04350 [Candidatus Pacebacteria bacterium CG_4_9_14_0_2_um_filter_40_15]
MSNIFVVNKGGHDFSKAERFGKLVYLSEGSIDPFKINSMYREMAEAISASHQDDYILSTGLPIMRQILSAMFAFKHGCLNLLLFKNGEYVERRILLGELIKKEQK